MSSRRDVFSELVPGATTHAGLWLDKGLADIEEKGGNRQAHFDELTQTIQIPASYKLFFARWREQVARVPPFTLLVEAQVRGRLIAGLGRESILETGITLNHTYGVPYLPGSSLKGLAAAIAHQKLEEEAWRRGEGESHRILFGDQESSGYVTFHDALWIPEASQRLPFDLDVMTVHHPKYYQGEDQPPSGIESPNPVAFLTARGRFLLAVSGPEAWARAAMRILRGALCEDGLGAKTAAGYGRFEPFEIPGDHQAGGGEATEWHLGRVFYQANTGELEARLNDGRSARASRLQAQELLAALPETLRAALTGRKREARAEAKVVQEGRGWRIVALRPVGG